MVQNEKYSRVDTRRLKSLIVGKIGRERAEKYFYQLGRLFTVRISKSEFNKICIHLIGRETLRLHNEFVRAILKNACCTRERLAASWSGELRGSQPVVGKERSCMHPSGLGFPASPRKIRLIGNRGYKFRDRPSPLGPHGKTHNAASKESAPMLQSPPELLSLGSRPPEISVEDGEEAEQLAGNPGVQSKSPVIAPLGILVDFGVAQKVLSENSRSSKFDQQIVYLKGMITPAMSIARSKKQEAPPCTIIEKAPGKFVQRPGNSSTLLSMLDLRDVAELDPRILGGNWQVQLEKVLTHSFDCNS